jgi:hypothetical protein
MVTDPPYGMSYKSGWSGSTVAGDSTPEVRDAVLASWGRRPAVVFGRWSEPKPANTKLCLIWDKGEWPGMGDLTMPWGPSHEEIYILGDGFVGKRMGSVLRAHRMGAAAASHPTQKPVGLMEGILRRCPPGTVIDPFMGSGTTLVAAKNLGRRAIGIEIEERYCEIAAQRLIQGVLPLDLAS